jgi:hypothetical protein
MLERCVLTVSLGVHYAEISFLLCFIIVIHHIQMAFMTRDFTLNMGSLDMNIFNLYLKSRPIRHEIFHCVNLTYYKFSCRSKIL